MISKSLGKSYTNWTVAVLIALISAYGSVALAKAGKGGQIPYFASLKADEVHVRKGPGREYDIVWTYRSLGLPVEVTAEHEHWRRVRDSGGAEGWVYFKLISALRMALVSPWEKSDHKIDLNAAKHAGSATVARLEPGVQVLIKTCSGVKCNVSVSGFTGWIDQQKLWGVYPGEIVK